MNEFEEISFFELIQIIIRQWKLVLLSLLLTLSLSTVLFFGFNAPQYTTESVHTVIFEKEYSTEFGLFNSPYTRIEEYSYHFWSNEFLEYISEKTQIEISEIKSSMNVITLNAHDLEIKISNYDQAKTKLIHDAFIQYAPRYFNYVLLGQMHDYFSLNYSKELNFLNIQLNTELFTEKYVFDELEQMPKLLDGNSTNPLYSILLDKWIQAKIEVAEVTYLISQVEANTTKINLLTQDNSTFENYLKQGEGNVNEKIAFKHGKPSEGMDYRFDAFILFPIAIILGIILGVFMVFIKSYWAMHTNKQR